jgi:hypothetical protein
MNMKNLSFVIHHMLLILIFVVTISCVQEEQTNPIPYSVQKPLIEVVDSLESDQRIGLSTLLESYETNLSELRKIENLGLLGGFRGIKLGQELEEYSYRDWRVNTSEDKYGLIELSNSLRYGKVSDYLNTRITDIDLQFFDNELVLIRLAIVEESGSFVNNLINVFNEPNVTNDFSATTERSETDAVTDYIRNLPANRWMRDQALVKSSPVHRNAIWRYQNIIYKLNHRTFYSGGARDPSLGRSLASGAGDDRLIVRRSNTISIYTTDYDKVLRELARRKEVEAEAKRLQQLRSL